MVNLKVPKREIYWIVRKPDFWVLLKIDDDDTEREFIFGEIKPPHCSNTINKSIIKLTEFMKGSLDFIIHIYSYVVGLETYGILIYDLLKQRIIDLETDNVRLKQIIEQNAKCNVRVEG
ncbi:4569_t:CDS:2 [Diversispora eburnea]|uniref:4569_t:CDS:1 n=1 Tax=Diversispora eburnea TaxID=1213867 RepID=A0A9N9AM58_9GLOM|nr:4569_t:CDS:2 [Diversispora eburnea]